MRITDEIMRDDDSDDDAVSPEVVYVHDALRRRRRFDKATWIKIALVALLVLAIILTPMFIYKYHRDRSDEIEELTEQVEAKPTGTHQVELDKHTKLDFSEAILGDQEARAVMEVSTQEVEIPYTVTQEGFASWGINRLTQNFRYYAKGVYKIDMAGVSEDDISYDTESDVVTIRVPYPTLTVDVDSTKTEIEDTEKGAFVHGDLKLTPEENQQIESQVKAQARTELTSKESYDKAKEHAEQVITDLYEPVVQSVSPSTKVGIIVSDPPLLEYD